MIVVQAARRGGRQQLQAHEHVERAWGDFPVYREQTWYASGWLTMRFPYDLQQANGRSFLYVVDLERPEHARRVPRLSFAYGHAAKAWQDIERLTRRLTADPGWAWREQLAYDRAELDAWRRGAKPGEPM